jgi:putative glutathione S-transferase
LRIFRTGTVVRAGMTIAQFPDEQVDGAFARQDDAFNGWVTADGRSGFPAVAGRYHLYVSLACPWAHRTIIVRALKGLEGAIGMTVVDPIRDERGWAFRPGPGTSADPVNGFAFLAEAYAATDPGYRGRVTVPVLWDTQTKRIVSNNDDHLMRMLETEFDAVATHHDLDFYPEEHRAEIDALNGEIYERVNNGVYRAGFATRQDVYEAAAAGVFDELDRLDARLADRRFLVGPEPVESDWRLFVTLIRFDAVYVGHFKCNLRRIADYPNLSGYLRDLYQFRNVASTVDFDHIKRHYYMTHDEINPTRIVPIGPQLDLDAPPRRDQFL